MKESGITIQPKKWIYYSKPDEGYENWNNYAYGYKQALKILIEKCENSGSQFALKDLVFPIFFLYRHLTELLLKEILHAYYDFKFIKRKVPDIHDLNLLWLDAKPIILEIFFDEQAGFLLKNRTNFAKTDIRKLNQQIKKLNTLDNKSFAFRYPVDKKGKQSIKEDIVEPLDVFKIHTEETYSSLSFVPFMIFHLKNNIFENSA
jgi:hypothetical protein